MSRKFDFPGLNPRIQFLFLILFLQKGLHFINPNIQSMSALKHLYGDINFLVIKKVVFVKRR